MARLFVVTDGSATDVSPFGPCWADRVSTIDGSLVECMSPATDELGLCLEHRASLIGG